MSGVRTALSDVPKPKLNGVFRIVLFVFRLIFFRYFEVTMTTICPSPSAFRRLLRICLRNKIRPIECRRRLRWKLLGSWVFSTFFSNDISFGSHQFLKVGVRIECTLKFYANCSCPFKWDRVVVTNSPADFFRQMAFIS